MRLCLQGLLVAAVLAGAAVAHGAEPVALFSPQGEVKGLRQVTARFAEQMVSFGQLRAPEPFDIDCAASGTGRWVDGSNYAYDFDADLPAGLHCRFTLKQGLTTLAGARLAGGQHFEFTTGGPAIVQSLPGQGEEWIDENQIFILGLDAAADAASIVRHAYCLADGVVERIPLRLVGGDQRRKVLAGRRDFGESYARLLFKSAGRNFSALLRLPASASDYDRFLRLADLPDSPLAVVQCRQRLPQEAKVELVWGAGIAATTGVVSSGEQRLPFKTRPAFSARFSCERMNKEAACIPVLPMSLAFSAPVPFIEAMKIRLIDAQGERLHPELERSKAIDGLVDSLSFKGPFAENAHYRLELPDALADDAGRRLVNAARFPLTVKTDAHPPLAKFAARFGILERYGEPALAVTLRNVEPRISAALTRTGRVGATGTMAGRSLRLLPGAEKEIVGWLRRLRQAEETLWRYDPKLERDVIEYQAGSSSIFSAADHASAFTLPKPGGARAFEVVGIPLARPGFYVVELASPRLGAALLGEPKPFHVQAAALVTNLAVHVKTGRESSLVWVTSLDRGQAVAGAEVVVRDCGGAVHFRGRSDTEGIVRVDRALPERNSLPPCLDSYDRQFFVTAAKGDDYSFTLTGWNEGIAPWRFNVPTGSGSGPYLAHAVFDRSLLRAGETVHMKLFVRRHSSTGLEVPNPRALGEVITLRHSGSDQRYELPVIWDAQGSATADWSIPDDAHQGSYEVLVRDRLPPLRAARGKANERSAGSFRVEAFRVPTMKAVLQGPRVALVDAREATMDIQLNYLSGGPVSHAPARLSSLLQPHSTRFADFDDFTFANGDVSLGAQRETPQGLEFGTYEVDGEAADEAAADSPNRPAGSLALQLDGVGAARAVLGPLPRSDRPQDLAVELEFRDANGETVSAATRVVLWPSKLLLGIKPDSWVASASNVKFQVLAVDLQGQPVAGARVDVDLLLRETYSHRRRLVGGFYAYEHNSEIKHLGAGCAGVSDERGLIHCEIVSPRSGNLILRATGHDADGRPSISHREVWVAGGEEWWFSASDNDRMDMLPEKKRYEPGETARLQLRMPFAKARVLVTTEREGVIDGFVREISRDKPVIELPVSGGHAPNVFVSALAVRGRVAGIAPTALVDLAKPAFRMGLAELKVGWAAHELKISVKPERERYRVREKARVVIEARRADGSPPPAGTEVALAAVDEGLLQLLPNDSWRLLDAMMMRRGLEVETATAQMQVVGKRHYGRKALAQGGGGGRAAARELFDTLLLWRARLRLDAAGRAEVEVPLNDSLGAFRIVAIGSAPGGLFGTAAATIDTSQDLILLAGLPPLVREGDRFSAGLTVRNASDGPLQIKVSAAHQARLAGRALGGEQQEAAQHLWLAAGEARELAWPLTVPIGADALSWRFAAEALEGEARDALRVSQSVAAAVPVRSLQATITQLAAPLTMSVAPPEGAIDGRGGLALTFAARLADDLPGVKEYMAAYPYSCLEQRASQAVALGEAGRWAATMASLPSHLDRDGLAKYFPLMDQGSDTLSAYLLSLAHESGWKIPEAARARMLDGLRHFVEGRVPRRSTLPTVDLAIRKIAAIDALTRHGVALEPGWLQSFSIDPNLWPTSALIDWLGIVARSPAMPDRAARLAQAQALLRARLTLNGGIMGFSTERNDALWWLMVSGDSNANRLLLAVMDLPDWRADMPRLVRGALGRQQRGHWNTTVANAWGSLALARFSAQFESQPVTGSSRARLGDAQRLRDWSVPASALVALPWKTDTLHIAHSGSGKPWVTLRSLAAVPLTAPLSAGYTIRRSVEPVAQKTPGLWQRGDVMRVRLLVAAQSDMSWVVASDPLPAGASVLGSGLGGHSKLAARGERRRGAVWPAFEERRLDAFRAYYAFVPKGEWTVEYTLRLNTPGEFSLPPTRVEAMYAPEVFGELPNPAVVVRP